MTRLFGKPAGLALSREACSSASHVSSKVSGAMRGEDGHCLAEAGVAARISALKHALSHLHMSCILAVDLRQVGPCQFEEIRFIHLRCRRFKA